MSRLLFEDESRNLDLKINISRIFAALSQLSSVRVLSTTNSQRWRYNFVDNHRVRIFATRCVHHLARRWLAWMTHREGLWWIAPMLLIEGAHAVDIVRALWWSARHFYHVAYQVVNTFTSFFWNNVSYQNGDGKHFALIGCKQFLDSLNATSLWAKAGCCKWI